MITIIFWRTYFISRYTPYFWLINSFVVWQTCLSLLNKLMTGTVFFISPLDAFMYSFFGLNRSWILLNFRPIVNIVWVCSTGVYHHGWWDIFAPNCSRSVATIIIIKISMRIFNVSNTMGRTEVGPVWLSA